MWLFRFRSFPLVARLTNAVIVAGAAGLILCTVIIVKQQIAIGDLSRKNTQIIQHDKQITKWVQTHTTSVPGPMGPSGLPGPSGAPGISLPGPSGLPGVPLPTLAVPIPSLLATPKPTPCHLPPGLCKRLKKI